MYTANTVEAYCGQLRKETKTEGAFSSDAALQKLVYVTIQSLYIKWETTALADRIYNWEELINQFSIIVEGRIERHRFD